MGISLAAVLGEALVLGAVLALGVLVAVVGAAPCTAGTEAGPGPDDPALREP
jgi:hypothetical protein